MTKRSAKTAEKLKALSEALPGIKEEDVSRLVFHTIDDARKSFILSLRLSQILFFAGLVMIAATFIAVIFLGNEQIWALVFGGASGFLGVISALLINPIPAGREDQRQDDEAGKQNDDFTGHDSLHQHE